MAERGKYIVFEGGDGTGKSVQAIDTTDRLMSLGVQCLLVHNDETGRMEPVQEPGGTPKADIIRKRIKDKNIIRTPWENVEWFTEARESIWEEAIEPALENGIWVVTARSWISTAAYQGYGEGVDLEKIRAYTREKVGQAYMTPDLVCILALKNENVRQSRINNRSGLDNQDTFESMPAEFQESMQNGYVRFGNDYGIEITDASRSQKDVQNALWRQVMTLL